MIKRNPLYHFGLGRNKYMAKQPWIQKAFAGAKKKGTIGTCTGEKFGSASCPKGSKRYTMAKTLRKMAASKIKKKKS